MANLSLEERAKKLLKYKITKKGRTPNPFTEDLTPVIDYLVKSGYVTKRGGNPVSLSYDVTPKGKKWAYGK